jgi:hypothetical protein
LFSILNNKVIDYYRLSARPLKKTSVWQKIAVLNFQMDF